ncbi:MAG: DinB family protein [Dehalococcoidia bacterium]
MDAPALLRLAFADLHTEVRRDVDGLTDEELFWQPAEGQNHVAFLLWHLIRDEDTVICQSVLAGEELWSRAGWSTRFGMDERDQGTGFDSSTLGNFRYSLPLLFEYADAVWAQTDRALVSMPADRLEEELAWSDEWRLANLLTTGCLAHGWVHLGEIRQVRGLRGWKFRE